MSSQHVRICAFLLSNRVIAHTGYHFRFITLASSLPNKILIRFYGQTQSVFMGSLNSIAFLKIAKISSSKNKLVD